MAFIDEIIELSIQAYKDFNKLLFQKDGKYVKIKVRVYTKDAIVFKEFLTTEKEFRETQKAIKELFQLDKIRLEVIKEKEREIIELTYNPISRSWLIIEQ